MTLAEFEEPVIIKIDGRTYVTPKWMLPIEADMYADMVLASKDQMQFVKNKLPMEVARAVARKQLGLTK